MCYSRGTVALSGLDIDDKRGSYTKIYSKSFEFRLCFTNDFHFVGDVSGVGWFVSVYPTRFV